MERINVLVSDEAKEVLVEYQRRHKLRRQDEALDTILLDQGDVCNE